MKKAINISISVFVLLVFGIYLFNNPENLNSLKLLNYNIISYLILIKIINLLLNSKFNQELLKVFKINLSFFEATYLSSITFLGNFYLPGKMGGNLRLIYLNKIYNFNTSQLTSIFFYFANITFLLSSLLAILSLLLIDTYKNLTYFLVLVSFATVAVITSYLMFKTFNLEVLTKNKINSWLNEVKKNWVLINSNLKVQIKLITITLINFLFFGIEVAVIFSVIFNDFLIFEIIYYNSISIFASFISVTPASLGFKDALVLVSNQIFSGEIFDLVSVLIIERAVGVIFSGLPFLVIIYKHLKKYLNLKK